MPDDEMNGMSGPTIDFHLYFAGLMVFTEGPDGAEALLVDARTPGRVPNTANTEPHQAVVQFALDGLVGDPRRFGNFEDAFHTQKGYWLLDRDVLSLDSGQETLQRGLNRSLVALQGQTPTPADQLSLQWTAPLRGKGGAPAKFKARKDLFAVEEAPLVAAVRLDRGSLQPAAFASELEQFVVSRFPHGSTQAMASVIEYQATVRAPVVRLTAEKFDGTQGDTLELVPSPGSGNRVEAWVMNREWDSIVRQKVTSPVKFGSPNPEYLFFHDLLRNPPTDLPRPSAPARATGVQPGRGDCRDRGMRKLYFATGGGEAAHASPCSPARG